MLLLLFSIFLSITSFVFPSSLFFSTFFPVSFHFSRFPAFISCIFLCFFKFLVPPPPISYHPLPCFPPLFPTPPPLPHVSLIVPYASFPSVITLRGFISSPPLRLSLIPRRLDNTSQSLSSKKKWRRRILVTFPLNSGKFSFLSGSPESLNFSSSPLS